MKNKKNRQRNYKHIFIYFKMSIKQRPNAMQVLCSYMRIDDFRRYFRIKFVLLFSDEKKE